MLTPTLFLPASAGFATGPLDETILGAKSAIDAGETAPVLVFEDRTGTQLDFDLELARGELSGAPRRSAAWSTTRESWTGRGERRQEAASCFLWAVAGDLPGFEGSLARALRGRPPAVSRLVARGPADAAITSSGCAPTAAAKGAWSVRPFIASAGGRARKTGTARRRFRRCESWTDVALIVAYAARLRVRGAVSPTRAASSRREERCVARRSCCTTDRPERMTHARAPIA